MRAVHTQAASKISSLCPIKSLNYFLATENRAHVKGASQKRLEKLIAMVFHDVPRWGKVVDQCEGRRDRLFNFRELEYNTCIRVLRSVAKQGWGTLYRILNRLKAEQLTASCTDWTRRAFASDNARHSAQQLGNSSHEFIATGRQHDAQGRQPSMLLQRPPATASSTGLSFLKAYLSHSAIAKNLLPYLKCSCKAPPM